MSTENTEEPQQQKPTTNSGPPPAVPPPPPGVNITPELLQKALEALEARPRTLSALYTAICNVQGSTRPVGKNEQADAGSYTFSFASLDAYWEAIRTAAYENKLAITQLPTFLSEKRMVKVVTQITHAPTTEFIRGELELPCTRTDPQGIGAVITYAQRYSLKAMLGLTQREENEEQVLSEMRNQPPPQSTQRPPAPPKPPPPPPKASPPPKDGEPPGEEDIAQQMRSCRTPAELSKVAAQAKGAFKGEPRDRLVKVYEACAAALKAGAK